jgi:hypothetical protein
MLPGEVLSFIFLGHLLAVGLLDDVLTKEVWFLPVADSQHDGASSNKNKYIFDKVYPLDIDRGTDCAKCSPATSGKDTDTFMDYERVMSINFGPFIGGHMACYFASHPYGGHMGQLICDICPIFGSSNDMAGGNGTAVTPPSAALTAAPTAHVPPVCPDGGDYPGILFPWNSSADSPIGYDFCGIIKIVWARIPGILDLNTDIDSLVQMERHAPVRVSPVLSFIYFLVMSTSSLFAMLVWK